jgi:hypothetical protein
MGEPIDLEIGLTRAAGEQYALDVRLNNPRDDTLRDPFSAAVVIPAKELADLRARGDWTGYGKVLSERIFQGAAKTMYDDGKRMAGVQNTGVRIRMRIDQSAPELHAVVWETLLDPNRVDPNAPAWLSTLPNVYFSRFRHEYQRP